MLIETYSPVHVGYNWFSASGRGYKNISNTLKQQISSSALSVQKCKNAESACKLNKEFWNRHMRIIILWVLQVYCQETSIDKISNQKLVDDFGLSEHSQRRNKSTSLYCFTASKCYANLSSLPTLQISWIPKTHCSFKAFIHCQWLPPPHRCRTFPLLLAQIGYGSFCGLWVWRSRTNCRPCCPPTSNPSTSPWTARPESCGWWDNCMTARRLSWNPVRSSSC